MQAALRLTARVQSGGRIEFADDQLTVGSAVEVIVLVPTSIPTVRHSVMDVLARVPGQLAFKSAADVDAYLQQERSEWER